MKQQLLEQEVARLRAYIVKLEEAILDGHDETQPIRLILAHRAEKEIA